MGLCDKTKNKKNRSFTEERTSFVFSDLCEVLARQWEVERLQGREGVGKSQAQDAFPALYQLGSDLGQPLQLLDLLLCTRKRSSSDR